ncbi:MAG: diaminopimelate decarboxylase [Candidatus Eremiobacteraeota bacterium]|nr:diaminopimelate decarboxylase [Candidatus Eremiobacteraeota bacterium]
MISAKKSKMRWNGELAPGHERIDGELTIGRAPALALARAYETPLLVIDLDVLDAAITEFTDACASHGIHVAYAGKALLFVALAQYLKQTPLLLDVCSLGELLTAERAGYPAERMYLHGCGKTDDEIRAAAAGRVGTIVVDNVEELQRLSKCARQTAPVRLLLRVNTGIEAHTHAFVQTAGENTKFGLRPKDVQSAAELLSGTPALRFAGLHSHIGSQIYEPAAFVANARALMKVAREMQLSGFDVEEVVIGGGFGIQSGPHDGEPLSIEQLLERVSFEVNDAAREAGMESPRIGVEPGRALIAHAGTSLYRVMTRKNQTSRSFAIVDGGITDNPRPALYDAYHHALLASRGSEVPPQRTVVCGRSCENDRLTEALLPGDLRADDLLAVCTTGAYTFSMASNYNRFNRPAVVFVQKGEHRLVVKRESVAELLQNDLDIEI